MSRLSRTVNIEDLRRMAKSRLPRAVFDFFDGGAEDETTLRGNRAAFERVRLLPRVMVDVSQVDTGIEIFGARAVLTGRATLFGVMAGGEAGAKRAIDILGGEFERALQLSGVPRAEDIGPDLLA